MDLTRTARVLAARWPIVAILAILGAVAGWWGAGYRNESIEPLWEARAPISLVEGAADEETARAADTIEARLEEVRDLALEVNREAIDIDPSTNAIETSPALTIIADADAGEVVFIAQAATEQEAVARASAIRTEYTSDPSQEAEDRIQQLITEVSRQMQEARSAINSAEAEVAALDPNTQRRTELQALADKLRGRLVDFQEELLIPAIVDRETQLNAPNADAEDTGPRPAEEIQADIDEVQTQLQAVEAQLAEIPPPVSTDYSQAATDLRVAQQRYTDLEADFQAYRLQLEDLENPVVTEAIDTTDVTPVDASPQLYALVGLMVGTALAAAGILSADRLRAPVWVSSDAPFLPTLASVVEREPSELTWYDRPTDLRRRSEIQALRAGILARLRDRSGSVSLAGSRVDSLGVRAAAADLAVAFAQSGRTVMLVDADFDPSDGLAEFPDGGLTLAKMVVDLRAGVPVELGQVASVRPNLWSMPSGSFDEDPADLFAGDILDRTFEALVERFDMVIVAAGELSETVAQEVITRTDTSLILSSSGRTLSTELKLYVDEFTRRGASLLGMLLVTRQAFPLLRRLKDRFYPKEPPVFTPTPSTVRSDVSEPAVVLAVPAEAEEAIVGAFNEDEGEEHREPIGVKGKVEHVEPEPRLYEVLRRPSEDGGRDASTTAEVATALASIDPAKAYGPMADFVADMAEEILLRPHQLGFEHDGMLPLHPVKDRTTVGSAIGRLLRDDMGSKEGAALERQIIEILFGTGPLKSVPVVRKSLDAWLSIAFARVHNARSGREPTILHLVSPHRFFQIMVDAHRFDSIHVATLADEVLPMFIEDVERQQRAARRFGSDEAIAQLDRAIADARDLGRTLNLLQTGADPNGRLFYPWSDDPYPEGWAPRWDEDVRASIAPLQRLGLLATPILSEEELEVMLAVG